MGKNKIMKFTKKQIENASDNLLHKAKFDIRFTLMCNHETRDLSGYEREKLLNRIWRLVKIKRDKLKTNQMVTV